ncbi:hypothetical protein DFH09DRAFT_1125744 [Mycena vulgaris]|nr:hypothetical protein DFH09DRAFT_1125744 [Mycena vulgaris]
MYCAVGPSTTVVILRMIRGEEVSCYTECRDYECPSAAGAAAAEGSRPANRPGSACALARATDPRDSGRTRRCIGPQGAATTAPWMLRRCTAARAAWAARSRGMRGEGSQSAGGDEAVGNGGVCRLGADSWRWRGVGQIVPSGAAAPRRVQRPRGGSDTPTQGCSLGAAVHCGVIGVRAAHGRGGVCPSGEGRPHAEGHRLDTGAARGVRDVMRGDAPVGSAGEGADEQRVMLGVFAIWIEHPEDDDASAAEGAVEGELEGAA